MEVEQEWKNACWYQVKTRRINSPVRFRIWVANLSIQKRLIERKTSQKFWMTRTKTHSKFQTSKIITYSSLLPQGNTSLNVKIVIRNALEHVKRHEHFLRDILATDRLHWVPFLWYTMYLRLGPIYYYYLYLF